MSNPAPLTLINGRLVLPAGEPRLGTLRCVDGQIAAVGDIAPQQGDTVIDAKGALIAPGLVDLGVFAIDKPACHFGGITRAALMPDQGVVLDKPSAVRFAAQSGKPDLWVHPLAAATKDLAGAELAELALMRDAGARAVSTGRRWIADSGVMHRLLSYCAMLGLVVITHAEDAGLTGSAVATAGEMATRLGLPSAPAEAEALAVARDLALAELTGARLHFRQVTTAAALALVRAAKARGVAVTAGVTPAHALLSDVAVGDFRTFTRLSPPLRSEADRQAVLAALEDKRLPFADAEPGMAGAETLLPLTLGLVRDGVIDTARAFALLAANPAALLGLDAGQLVAGAAADIAIIDPDKPWIVDSDRMAAAAGNPPFDRQGVQGRTLKLFKGGLAIG